MTDTILGAAAKWLWDHKPDVILTALILIPGFWLVIEVSGYVRRLESVEKAVVDIRQLDIPQVRQEMHEKFDNVDKRFEQVDKRFEQVDERFEKIETDIVDVKLELVQIKLYLQKFDTYFASTHKDYPQNDPHK
jgi:hypothetical protein